MSESSPSRKPNTAPRPSPDGRQWYSRVRSAWQPDATWRAPLAFTFLYIGILLWGGRMAWLWLVTGERWWPAIVVVAALVVVTVFYLVTVLFQRWRAAKEWVIQRSVAFVTLLAMVVLAVGFVLWLLVNFFWAADDRLLSSAQTEMVPTGSSTTVAVSATSPYVALVDAADNQLRLEFTVPDGGNLPATTFNVGVKPGEGLTFPGATGQGVLTTTVDIQPFQPGVVLIDLINAQTYGGLRRAGKVTINLTDPSGTRLGETIAIPVLVEGRRGFALRRFIAGTVNDNSPYIFLLLLIAPGLAALTQKTIDQRYAELKARQRDEYNRLVELCRAQFRARNLPGVARVLQDMAKPQYAELTGDTLLLGREFYRFATLERPTMLPAAMAGNREEARKKALAEWKKALEKWPDKQLIAMAGRWQEEFIAAWLEAKNRLHPYCDELAKSGSSAEAIDALRAKLKAFLDEAKDKIGSWDLATNDKTLLDAFNARVASDVLRFSADDEASRGIEGASLTIPFAHDRADNEDEARFLKVGAFYGGHPLWRRLLSDAVRSTIIYGEEGCGRTAAVVWCEHAVDGRFAGQLRVRLSGRPNMNEICAAVLETLFHKLATAPDNMALLLNVGQQELLADLLLAHLSYGWLLFRIEEAQKQRPDDTPLRLEQFKRLLKTRADNPQQLVALRAGRASSPTGMYRSIAEITCSLGYDQIVLIYDAAKRDKPDKRDREDEKWLRTQVFNWLGQWHSTRTRFYVFAPQTLYDELVRSELPVNLSKERLTWDYQHFRELVISRYGRFLWTTGAADGDLSVFKSAAHILDLFEDKTDEKPKLFDALLHSSRRSSALDEGYEDYNPRQFMRLWRTTVGNRSGDVTISKEDVERAIGEHGESAK